MKLFFAVMLGVLGVQDAHSCLPLVGEYTGKLRIEQIACTQVSFFENGKSLVLPIGKLTRVGINSTAYARYFEQDSRIGKEDKLVVEFVFDKPLRTSDRETVITGVTDTWHWGHSNNLEKYSVVHYLRKSGRFDNYESRTYRRK